ncbi:hypothetical protein [Polyangium jinanense]|uniref:Lipoprotein n=1 Tax=Polyangium jinanense TaxID=2829994 RepID=A0A9X4AWD2_9BACT|nr:hypothetical protein [Polyangium jinanense]MDC3956775.1 hypothetical protein [Polyangium jinanense]MDC3987229.1 hypothetical protein [Polyangium jinanense]
MKPFVIILAAVTFLGCGGSAEPEPATPESTLPSTPPVDDAPVEQSEWTGGTITGLVRLAENAKPIESPDFELILTLSGGNIRKTERVELGKIKKKLSGPAPYAFEIQADQSKFDPFDNYTISGFIAAPDGNFWYSVKDLPRVYVKGQKPGPVEVEVIPVDPRAGK